MILVGGASRAQERAVAPGCDPSAALVCLLASDEFDAAALEGRLGLTVRFTVAGVTSLRCDFATRLAPSIRLTVQIQLFYEQYERFGT
jgi:hypothetical protein